MSVRKSSQRSFLSLRQGRARHVHDHGQRRVIADESGHIDHALLAKLAYRPRVSRIADAVVLPQLAAEIVDNLFVARHSRGTASFGYGADRLFLHSGLPSVPLAHASFVFPPP